MQKAIKRVGVDDFWTLADNPSCFPRNAEHADDLAAIIIARNLAHGFEVEPEVRRKAGRSRCRILSIHGAWRAGTTIDQIQTLNPELRRWTTPLKDTQYELKVPAGTGEFVTARLQDASPVELVSLQWYTVKKGETLPAVARKLGVAQSDLTEANELKSNARLAAGQKLMVPREATVLMAARTERTVPVADSRIATQALLLAKFRQFNWVKVSYLVRERHAVVDRQNLPTAYMLQTWNKIQAASSPPHRLTIHRSRSPRH